MLKESCRVSLSLFLRLLLATALAGAAFAQSPVFTPGNVIVTVEGCGVYNGTCTNVPNGTGTGTGNSSNTGYGDNEAAPLTLFQFAPDGVSSVGYVNSLVLPQTASGANLPVSGEYGSSSEAGLQIDGTGRYLTVMGYGINAATFDDFYHPAVAPGNYAAGSAATDPYGAAPSGALAQSGSLTGQYYTPIPRVIATIDAYGNVNSSSANYNVYNTNNPRSTYSLDGFNFYMSGQGSGCDLTGGVFLTMFGNTNDSPTAITGGDAAPTSSCIASGYTGSLVAQDTRVLQIYNGTLYISTDSTEGKSDNRSFLGTLGDPPSTSMYVSSNVPTGDTNGPSELNGFGNSGGTGRVQLTSAETNGLNANNDYVNLSPESYFFASPTVLYVADSGSPKNNSADGKSPYTLCGAGGLQKWVNESGAWTWVYSLYKGLNLVKNNTSDSSVANSACSSNTAGTTGLHGLAGTVVDGATAYLYATNYTIGDLDPTYLYGISDPVSATTNPNTNNTFVQLAAAPQDSNFKGVSFAPSLPAGSATITSSPSGLPVSIGGAGCVPAGYSSPATFTTPFTLVWTPSSACQLSVASTQSVSGTQYDFGQWQDGTTITTDNVTAQSTSAVYTAAYKAVPTVTWPTASAIPYGQTLASSNLTGGSASTNGQFTFTYPNTEPNAGPTDPQSVTFTPSDPSEYTTVTGSVNVPVSKAPLTVTAVNTTREVGAANPAFTPSYSGFVYGQTSSVLIGSPSLSTAATAASPTGNYPINVTVGTLASSNYAFTFEPGTLFVGAAPAVSLLTTSAVTGSAASGYTLTITVENTGTSAVSSVALTAAKLGAVSATALPPSIATIAAGASKTFTVQFPGTVGADNTAVAESYSGAVTGGSFSASVRSVTLP